MARRRGRASKAWAALTLALLILGSGCHDGPFQPRVPTAAQWATESATQVSAAPGDTVPGVFTVYVTDSRGTPVAGAITSWRVTGTGAAVLTASGSTDASGRASARWRMGTIAAEVQSLTASVNMQRGALSLTTFAVARPSRAARLEIADTIAVRLGDSQPVAVRAIDAFGNVFTPDSIAVTVLDSALATAIGNSVAGRKRGYTRASVSAASAVDTCVIHVHQVAARILAPLDTVRLNALGDTAAFNVTILDDRARDIADTMIVVEPSVTAVTAIASGPRRVQVISHAVGVGAVTLRIGSVSATVHAVVAQVAARLVAGRDSVVSDAIADTATLTANVLDRLGNPIPGVIISWRSSDLRVATVDGSGIVHTVGDGIGRLVGEAAGVAADTIVVRVAQRAAHIAFGVPSLNVTAFGFFQLPTAAPVDRNGQPMQRHAALTANDSSILRIDSESFGFARSNGSTAVVATIDGVTASLTVTVAQRAARLIPALDTLVIDALATRRIIPVVAVDANGNPVAQPLVATTIDDSTIARVTGSREVQSVANGLTSARVSVDGVTATIPVRVEQRAVRIDVKGNLPVLMLAGAGSSLPLTCTAYDGTDHPLSAVPTVRARNGRVTGTQCATLTAVASGHDTVEMTAPGFRADEPIVVALHALVERPIGDAILLDSMPNATGPWAPTARIRSTGEIEMYATGYQVADNRGDLHRYVSNDGIHFRYDGVAVRRDSDPCALRGSGIENVSIVERNDGPGWRMFFAAGAFDCYGWQVFSAVSGDERNWMIEPGIRLSNGGSVPPDQSVTPPWPTGEGMQVDRMPNGEWRMIVSAYERTLPAQDIWQITEWRSTDQINWRYVGVVLSTSQMPREAQASIYSPAVREFAPGLWRMIMTGDNRRDADSRSRLWTAVSTDKRTWRFEGELMGAVGSQLLYSSLAGDRVYFLRKDGAGPNYIAQTSITMP